MWGDKGAAPPPGLTPLPTPNGQKTMAEYIVNFRKIERFVDRVVMTPIHTKHMSDKETELLKRNLIKVGYKYIGRSKDMYDNYYTTYERKSIEQSTDSREVIFRVTITTLIKINEYGKDNNTYER